MKYIRTKETDYGCIIDTLRYKNETGEDCYISENEIVKSADTIEELIQSGDLVEFEVQMFMRPLIAQVRVHKVSYSNGIELSIPGVAFGTKNVKALWVQTPNGDFHKVAEKKTEEGELELLWKKD